ncbi:MAG: D-alanyl-D-alanine carboxypeptidase/D-alanyl-D-alanine-endopeptidase [Gemmatimonadales bacterium]
MLSPTAILLLVAIGPTQRAVAQHGLAQRIDRITEAPPLHRATWGILLVDHRGRERYARNADRLFVPASNAKIVVTATATALLDPAFRVVTSVYGSGPVIDGVLRGDLVVYGRGDPTFSERCYSTDTLAVGACDSLWTRMDALADSIVARGVRHVSGAIVGDGSSFSGPQVHPAWETYDVNWWYAAPVSGLGFNDNSLNLRWGPGATVDAPATIRMEPRLDIFPLENRTRTVPADSGRSIDFFRIPGTRQLWSEGTVPLGTRERTEYFAVPDPDLFFAAALRHALAQRGVSIAGATTSTTDSLRYRHVREAPALVDVPSRPLADIIFPVLNTSQNWFAEMLLKVLGREIAGDGSWRGGLTVERRFLIDSVGIDSTAFGLTDASGLSSGNVITPRALAHVLRYMRMHPNGAAFLRALPRSGAPGSLRTRFAGTPLEGHVVAKTGSIYRVNALSGFIERDNGEVWTFVVMLNNHNARYRAVLDAIDAVVLEMGR